MLELDQTKVNELKQTISCDDEATIRDICGFRKNAEKYPLIYKEKLAGQPIPEKHLIEYVAICQESEAPSFHSLLIRLNDDRWTRICAAYLNEMQAEDYEMPEDLSMEALSDDDLFA